MFALGIIGVVVFAALGSVWLVAVALMVCAAAVVLLYQVGKAIS